MTAMNGERSFAPDTSERIDGKEKWRSRVMGTVGCVAIAVFAGAYGTNSTQSDEYVPSTGSQIVTTPSEHEPTRTVQGEWSVMPGLADPNIYKENDNSFYLSGTGQDTSTIPIYHSNNLRYFSQVDQYNPSVLDPSHDYCNLWAPDITKNRDGKNQIFFTARQINEGQACENSNNEQTIFYATSSGTDMDFGAPQTIDAGPGTPRSNTKKGCLPDGCENTLRIDPEIVTGKNGDRWLFYNWFGSGKNVIAATNLDDPSRHHEAAIPTYADGNINEAPDVFKKDGKYYMLYSHNFFDSDYGLSYIKADNIEELTRNLQQPRSIASAEQAQNGNLLQNVGHSSVVESNGEYYAFYHKGSFDENGTFTHRDTYAQQLHFGDDRIGELSIDSVEYTT